MPWLKIVALCIAAAVCCGIVHDQITARICIEYFTVGHPPVFATTDPTLLGLGGVIATWWVGVLLGVPLAAAARAGSRPKRSAGSLLPAVVRLLVLMAAIALAAGATGWALGRAGVIFLLEPLCQQLPPERHVPFIAVLWAHSASYLGSFLGGSVLMASVWRARGKASRNEAGQGGL